MEQIRNLDGLMHIELLNGQARALLMRSTHLVDVARRIHGAGRVATAALGRALTCAGMMAATLKGEKNSLSVTIRGGGPLGTLIVAVNAAGDIKGWVQNPDVDLPRRSDGKLPVGDAVGHDGVLTVVKDLGMREPYVGQVRLVSGEIAEDFAMYFAASEQVPSLVSAGVLVGERVESAGGLIVQMLPGAEEDAVRQIEACAGRFENISSLFRDMTLEDAAEALLSPLAMRVLERRVVRYHCDCSRERMERALISMGRAELRQLVEEARAGIGVEADGAIALGCQFCQRVQRFTAQDLAALLEQAVR